MEKEQNGQPIQEVNDFFNEKAPPHVRKDALRQAQKKARNEHHDGQENVEKISFRDQGDVG